MKSDAMKYALAILLILIPSVAFGQQSVQGTPNGYPVAVQGVASGTPVPISGTVTSTLCTSATCTETVVQPTASNLNATVVQGTQSTGVAGWAITTAWCSGATCYTSPVAWGATTLTSGSTSTITSTTTVIDDGSSCVNLTAAMATFGVTDGNDVPIVPTGYQLPAYSIFSFRDQIGTIMTSGIRASAGTASAISCRFKGKQ